MHELLRLYSGLMRATFIKILEYRAQAVLWMLSSIAPLIMMAVWLSIVAEVGPIVGWQHSDFVAYYLGLVLVERLTSVWPWQWDQDIRTGELSTKLLKPIDPFHFHLSEQLGWKVQFLLLIAPIIIGVIWWSQAIKHPLNGIQFGAFVLSILAGFTLSMVMSTAFAMLSFWLTQSMKLYTLWQGVGQFFSGFIAPIALLPSFIQQIAYLLPFRSLISLPIEILMGQLDLLEIGQGLAITLAWISFFWLMYRLLWRWGLRHYEAVGA